MKYFILFSILVCSVLHSNNLPDYEVQFTAKVLYCESANTTLLEKRLVFSVMQNRLSNIKFDGKRNTVFEIVTKPKAFSCIDSELWRKPMNVIDRKVYNECLMIVKTQSKPINDKIVLYHDKSIEKPESWKGYKRALTTEHFVFYMFK